MPKPASRGLRWFSAMVLVDVLFAGRIWGLPVLTALTPSKAWSEQHGRRHRPVTEWARLLLLTLRRWLPGRSVVAVMDGEFAALELLHALRSSVVVISRMRKDARLFDPPSSRHCQLVGLRSRWCVTGTACPWLCRSGDAGDLGPNLKGLGAVGSILGGRHLMAAEVEEVVDPVMGGKETLRLAR